MQQHEERVVKEKEELDEKKDKLKAFFETKIYDGMPEREKLLLVKQLNAMTTYSAILRERISLFPKDDLGELDASAVCKAQDDACDCCQ